METEAITLSDDEKRVLGALGHADYDFGCYGFNTLSQSLGMPRERIRAACRSLRDKRLVEYHRTLQTEDGDFVGAGYGATYAGRDLCAKDKSIPYLEV